MSTGEFLHVPVILYIDGVLCDYDSMTINYGLESIPTLNISLPPDMHMYRFGAEDRVRAAVFYADLWYDPANPEFRLLFDGEISGCGQQFSSTNNAFTLTAYGHINILDFWHCMFMGNYDQIIQSRLEEITTEDVNTIASARVVMPYSLFKDGFFFNIDDNASLDSESGIKRPYDFILNLFRGFISTDLTAEERTIPGVNFLSRHCKKTKLNQRFVALPFFDDESSKASGGFPILKAVQDLSALQAVAQQTGQMANRGSMYALLNFLAQSIEMEVVSLPTAPAYITTYNKGLNEGQYSSWSEGKTKMLGQQFFKPQAQFAIPPLFNTLFPSMIQAIGYTENFFAKPTRGYMPDMGVMQSLNAADGAVSDTASAVLTRGYPYFLDRLMKQNNSEGGTGRKGYNILLYPDEVYRGPSIFKTEAPQWMHYLSREGEVSNPDLFLSQYKISDIYPLESNEETYRQVLGADYVASIMIVRDVSFLYLAREFSKANYSNNNLNIVLSCFNPYLVPGFPFVAMKHGPGSTYIGYIKSVSHTISNAGQLNTAIQTDCNRTYTEFLSTLQSQIKESHLIYQSAPLDPIPETRRSLQLRHNANIFYSRMFFPLGSRNADSNKTFNFKDYLDWVNSSGSREVIKLEGLVNEELFDAAVNDMEKLWEGYSESRNLAQRNADALEDLTQIARDIYSHRNDRVSSDTSNLSNALALANYGDLSWSNTVPQNHQAYPVLERLASIYAGVRTLYGNEIPTLNYGTSEAVGRTEQYYINAILDILLKAATGTKSSQQMADELLVMFRSQLENFSYSNLDENLTKYREGYYLDNKLEKADIFNKLNRSLQEVSRPICTIEEYVEFINSDKTKDEVDEIKLPRNTVSISGLKAYKILYKYANVGDAITEVNEAISSCCMGDAADSLDDVASSKIKDTYQNWQDRVEKFYNATHGKIIRGR